MRYCSAGPSDFSLRYPAATFAATKAPKSKRMSDRRGEPRNLPPKLETNRLDDRPTLVSTSRPFAWVPYICINSGALYGGPGCERMEGATPCFPFPAT